MRPEQGDMPPAQPLPEVTALLQALRQIKASKNLSLDAFTHDTGYSRSSWNRVLKGTAFPPRTAVERLCSRRGLDKEKLLGLWDTADQARRAADAQEETAAEAALVPVPATPAQGVPDPVPPTTPDPVPPTAPAPADPAPPTAPDPAPGTATPKPAAASPAPAPSTPGPAEPARPAAAPRSRIKILALTAAALAALLLVGRWYSAYETENPTTIEVGGDNRPDDDQPVVDETPLPPKNSTAPTTAPKDGEKKNKDQDPTGEEDTNTKPPRPSSSAKDQASSPASASASPSTADSPGAAGRANCPYNWDRKQVMAKGMVGSKVKEIQCLLNYNYDYTLALDSNFGESTDTAVRAVQSCSGLKPDGQVGPQTWKYLDTPMAGCGH
ncbi:peptidoglycan-binding protein [Streptomyces sp. NPDC046631]|uniref:peptidoglycan-binding protein n=1 Tax=unclassified Streptomyces TaxID=2593676 RepID=UPI0033F79204